MVISGRERGKTGKVLRVLSNKNAVVIERVNMVKRHSRPRGPQQPGGIVEKEAAIRVSNIMMMCDKATRQCASDERFWRMEKKSASADGVAKP
jgi:large subunit ribosomal protein L24